MKRQNNFLQLRYQLQMDQIFVLNEPHKIIFVLNEPHKIIFVLNEPHNFCCTSGNDKLEVNWLSHYLLL